MATEHDDDGPAAHGPAAGHKGGKLLNGPHREMIIVVCSVVGVGLAFATLRAGKRSGSAPAQTAAMGYPGSTATLSSGQVAGFDQAAVVGLQTMLANQSDQLRNLSSALPANYGAGAAPATPSPLASTLFAPSDSQNFMLYGDGTVTQVQNDGSQLGLNYSQWVGSGWNQKFTPTAANQAHPGGSYYETTGNLNAVKSPAAAGKG